MKLTKKEQAEVLKVYDIWLNSYLNGDFKTCESYLDDRYRLIGATNNEDFLNRKETTHFFKETSVHLAGKYEIRNSIRTLEKFDELVFITELFDVYFLNGNDWKLNAQYRFTSILKKSNEGWRFIYQHFSTPGLKAQNGEKSVIEQIAAENLMLHEEVKRITLELEHKNKALEIESALELVRARAMAMQHSNELATASQLLFQQFHALGIHTFTCTCMFIEEEKNLQRWWVVVPDGTLLPDFIDFPLTGDPILDDLYQSWKEKKPIHEVEIHGKLNKQHQRFLASRVHQQFSEHIVSNIPDRIFFYSANFSHGYLFIASTNPLSAEEKNITVRFANVFQQTYTRFLDLQKAEAQAREARIEASLEKIRARAMGMQTPDELSRIAGLIYQELTLLDLNLDRSFIQIFDPQTLDVTWWMASNESPLIPKGYKLQHNNFPLQLAYVKGWRERAERWIYILEGEEKKVWDDYIFSHTELAQIPEVSKDAMKAVKRAIASASFGSFGCITIGSTELLPKNSFDILHRFTGVFDFAYTRFLDLQKAQAQAREAQIETALERVRARAMAMHTSGELKEVARELRTQLGKLGQKDLETCAIHLYEESPDFFHAWAAVRPPKIDGGIIESEVILPKKGTQLVEEMVKAYFTKKQEYVLFVEGEKAQEWFTLLKRYDPKVVDLIIESRVRDEDNREWNGFYFSLADFPGGSLVMVTYATPEIDSRSLLRRFSNVFGIAYRRFADLKKAEAQTREAHIEAALERVRAKAMAMHGSKDISDATAVVFNELSKLGVEMERCGIVIFNESPVIEVWSTPLSPKNKQVIEVISGNLDTSIHPLLQGIYKTWEENKDFYTYELKGKEVKKYYDLLEKAPEYRFPKIAKYKKLQLIHVFYFSEGGIFAYTKNNMSDEVKQIFLRFTNVFSLTYTRYLDIVKAEAQAREAQIEAALERVRAKAMAMHNSEDLHATIGAFYRELEQFSITPRRCGVGLLQKENRVAELSTMNTMEHGNSIEIIGKLRMEGHWVLEGVYENWCLQKEYHPVLRGNEIKEYNQLLRPQVAFPEYPDSSVQYGYFFFFPEGGVYAWTEKEMKENELKIYRKFTNVLSLTYKRYKELKDSESNAHEALRRASLDRVRAEIASMRTVGDLQHITPIIWHELIVLGVPFVRCGVFIMNEENEHIQVYLSAPNGHSLAALNISFHSSKLAINTVDHWRQGIIFKTHWNRQEFTNWMNSMIELGQVSSQETYQGAAQPPESLHLHFVPFKQGMLYVGNTSPLNKEALELVKALSESFSIAYARYEDFRQLESAKNQIEKTLTELKATQAQLIQSEKMASLGELTAGIAHEIQNPLNFVNNFSEISKELLSEMKEELTTGSKQEAITIANDVILNLDKINHHGKRADAIVKGMLQHSRISSGQKEPTDINALADEYLRLSYHGLRAQDKSFNADFKTNFDPYLPKINVIPQDIGRVLLNLINNAFYAVQVETQHAASLQHQTPQKQPGYKPMVMVSTKNMGNHVEIRVKDNGPGIPSEIKDKIFQPFFTTKPTGQGTGLGLSLSYDIVKSHGGELTVETKDIEGSTFIIHLPIADL